MKKIISILFLTVFLISCGPNSLVQDNVSPENTQQTENQDSDISSEKILVTASIIPLASLINSIGGNAVEVNTIVPAGVSPHGFDLSARQMVEIEKSEVIFMVGLEEIDGFLERSSNREKQVHLADGIPLIQASAHMHHEDEEGHEDEHQEEHHEEHVEDEHGHDKDPHVWLGKENIVLIAHKVRDELSRILPEDAAYFRENTETFKTELELIYNDFAEKTEGKTPREFIVFHDAYNYLMESVGMDLDLKIPFSENVIHESGTAHMTEIIQEIELHGVRNIFREPQFRDGNLQKFASEYNLEVGILDPLGTDGSASGYFINLKNNLESLETIYE